MSFKNLENPKKKVYCHICERDITKHTYCFCEDCGDIELCIQCFANGRETLKHKRSHRYRVFSRLDFPVLEAKWSAVDELLLLEAIETYGYGNWDDIKSHIGGKSRVEVEKHFHGCYLSNFKKGDWQKGNSFQFFEEFSQSKINSMHIHNLNVESDENHFETLLELKLKSLNDVIKKAQEIAEKNGMNPHDKNSIYGEILGFMPLREEFDIEYDNDAELFLAEMEFNVEDTDEEIKMKYCILEIYNRRLKEREKRKRFVIERGLLNLKEQFAKEKRMSEEEREIRNFLKPFMRFQSNEEHEELVHCLLKDLEMKKTIEQLIAAEQIGIQNLAELENLVFSNESTFKLEKKLLEFNEKKSRQKGNTPNERRSARNLNQGSFDPKENVPASNDILTKNDESGYNLCYNEIELCEKMAISFGDYLLIKEFLVRECINRGFLDKRTAYKALNIDQKEYNQIFDFLVENNVILQKGI